jgi:hypothetical protein
MTRWTRYRQRYQRRRNAFLLLTLSGAIRQADVEEDLVSVQGCALAEKRSRFSRESWTDPAI